MAAINKNVIITKAARKKMVQARAGAISLPKIVGMAFGDGGTDSSGNVLAPSESQATLKHELLRKPINGYSFTADTICRYECTLTEPELAGKDISEVGLYDAAGDIVCIKNFKKKGKDDDLEMTFTLDDVF